MDKLNGADGLAVNALMLAILTAARTNEVLGATWGEINLDAIARRAFKANADGGAERAKGGCAYPVSVRVWESMPHGGGCGPELAGASGRLALGRCLA
jgi:hypothetical protein